MGGDLTQQGSSQTGMTDLINATKGQALNTGALVQSSQNLVTSNNDLVTSTTNLVTQATNQVTQTTNLVTQTTNLVTAVTNLTTAINNALSLGPWNTWVPVIAAGTGTFTTLGTIVSRYAQAGKNVYFSLSIPIVTNGTAATFVSATLPVTAKALTTFVARETVANGKGLASSVPAASSTMTIGNYDSTYPGGDGFTLTISGVYEAQ